MSTEGLHKNTTDEPASFSVNHKFAPALLDPDLEIPAGMVGPNGNPAPKRFSVYRNNVVVSLMEAMAETFPSIKTIIGEENFATLTRAFIASHPPSSPMMQAYGEEFPQFLEAFAPLANYPFLSDVAQVEISWIDAYHAADAQPLDGALLGEIKPDNLMNTRFDVHPATRLIKSAYQLHHLFSSRENSSAELNFEKNENISAVLITRPNLVVETCQLDHATTPFIENLASSHTLGESIETAMQADQNFDASAAITLMLTSGAMTAISNTTS
ncbi:MAG: DNA-binding domain-containing protein [Rhizobiaceae bacterium]|nr:DNA-binding domain-containing protein [Rhizobiaceae bacterium]